MIFVFKCTVHLNNNFFLSNQDFKYMVCAHSETGEGVTREVDIKMTLFNQVRHDY